MPQRQYVQSTDHWAAVMRSANVAIEIRNHRTYGAAVSRAQRLQATA